jgi:transporter family protein
MKSYVMFAMLAGVLWGLGGYFEKTGLRLIGIPPIAGITIRTAVALVVLGLISIPAWKAFSPQPNPMAWLMIFIGGGVIAGSLGMWSFYTSLSTTENLGVTLAIAFALSPLTGTVVGLIRGDQPMDLRLGLGLAAIIGGILLIQMGHSAGKG